MPKKIAISSTTTPPDDRRSQRTRVALRDALLDLVVERGWDDIAVQDLCERANIGRSTFYTHYPNKDALLIGALDDLRRFLRQFGTLRLSNQEPESFGFAQGLIEHAHEQRRLFRSLVGRRSGYVVQQRFREMVVKLVGDELPPGDAPGLPRSAAQRWIAGAFVELLGWWVEQSSPISPEALAMMFEDLARPVWAALADGKHT